MRKKLICLLGAAVLLVGTLVGCGQKASSSKGIDFTAENEIVTYDRIDPNKTQITVARVGNVEVKDFCAAFEAKNPDVQTIYLDITGGNAKVKPAIDWIKAGYTPDIIITAAGFFPEEEIPAYFENLSTSAIIDNYETDALQRTAVNSNVYWLPGPSNINGLIYNKTLFDQYGWATPTTFDEFIALCAQIKADTGGTVEAWNPNAKYSDELAIALQGFSYEELFGGADNRAWYNDYCEGKATFAGHMEPYYAMIQTLVDNDILREEHFNYSATARGKEFASGKIAMTNQVVSNLDTEAYDFSYMPFPATKGELGYICDRFSCFLSLPKQERSTQEQEAVDKFVDYASSVEGQQAYIGNSVKVSNVKGVPLSQSGDLASLQPAINAGHMFEQLDFKRVSGAATASLHQDAHDIAAGTKTPAQCLADADTKKTEGNTTEEKKAEVIATAPKDMTILETSFYIADAYRDKADADIGLIANSAVYRGNVMRIFAGELTTDFNTVLMPRSFGNGTKLAKVEMTGQQLLDALNAPLGNSGVENCIYAYSGLKCEVAPWNDLGSKYLSVKMADSSEVDPLKTYTVAIWEGTVADQYITSVIEKYDDSFSDLMTAKMKADKTVKAANDKRITLVWD